MISNVSQRNPWCSAFCLFHLSDLEKSVEEIQKESSVNHKLVTVQELEEKASVLRKLGETLTELKSESRWRIAHSVHREKTTTQKKHQSSTLADSL